MPNEVTETQEEMISISIKKRLPVIKVREFTISHILEQWHLIFHIRSVLSYAETTLLDEDSGDVQPVSALEFF